jgi:hypothetical protein
MEVDRKELLKFQLEQEVLDDNSQELRVRVFLFCAHTMLL